MHASIEEFFDDILTVKLSEDKKSVDILDQTLLPGRVERRKLCTKEDIWEAIHTLRVRGAPAIGVCAAYGLAVCAAAVSAENFSDFYSVFSDIREYLASSRPTAVNLFWALRRMDERARQEAERPVASIKEALFEEATAIREEDVQISRGIGEIGFSILKELKKEGRPLGILTHCNAGTLATAKYGTATAPLYVALEQGWEPCDMHAYCDETRPLLQGARLTAFELSRTGIPTTVQCDNMAASLMQAGKIDVIFVGADRVAANGDTANKIGTNSVAILAKHYGIPLYVCAPSSTIDLATPTGREIPIEERDGKEISALWYKEPMVCDGVEFFNPAFDVTDHSLLTGIITERGLCRAPFEEAFRGAGLT